MSSSSHTLSRSLRAIVGFVGGLIGVAAIVGGVVAFADSYRPADRVTRLPPSQTEVLPERFLRGFDPVTVTFTGDVGAGPGPADDASTLATLKPAWPGAWSFADKRTLQFRPAEPWPALRRVSIETRGPGAAGTKVLSTMMTAPQGMQPDDGATGLPPFRTMTLTFPQPLAVEVLKTMLRFEVRDLPGLSDAKRRPVEGFALALLPRSEERDPATYAITLDEEVGEGSMLVVTLALALGDEDSTLWRARLSTRTDFRLEEVSCAGTRVSVAGSPQTQGDQAIDCGSAGEEPQLVFSAPVGALSLTSLKKLVRLEPAVPDLSPRIAGKRVVLSGRFAPDTLYRLRIGDAPVFDDLGRRLKNPGDATVHFFVGWQQAHLRVKQGQVTVEQNGPRMLPVSAYGDTRADVRIHRIDPRHTGLWPFADDPVVIDESSAPPFPGEEPDVEAVPGAVSRSALVEHVRLLGAPLISRLVDLPKKTTIGTTSFGLDIGALLDQAPGLGRRPAGTYLVGVRRLQGEATRTWTRMQVSNLSVTAVEERSQAVLLVRALDSGQPVKGAAITVEAMTEAQPGKPSVLVKRTVSTEADGRAVFSPEPSWARLVRLSVERGDDVLIIDPSDPPPHFFNNHWSAGRGFLAMLTEPVPPTRKDDTALGFLFSERPMYRPGEKVFLKGWAREKKDGLLAMPSPIRLTKTAPLLPPKLTIKVTRPSGEEVALSTTTTALFGADATFDDSDPATGTYVARLFVGAQQEPVAVRRFQIEAYRIPTFEVQLSGPSRARLDQPFKVRASARYYAGGSVAEQAVRWTVTRRPAWHTPKGREGFLFASSSQFARPETTPKPEQQSSTATLDAAGSHSIEVNPEKDLDGSPRTYRFEATVTGADDQEVSAVTEVLALPPFVLGMKLDRYRTEATSIEPQLIAVGVDDTLLAGQKIEVRLFKRTWHSHLRESHFATGEASYVTEQEDQKLEEKMVTTTADPLTVSLPTRGAGVYVVELVARDALGRVQTLSADLYIGGKEPVAWGKGQAGVFELVPDKSRYAPGDTATVIVKSPFGTARGLLIIEGAARNEYRQFDVVGGTATVTVAIDKSVIPNLPVHVVLSRGRLGESPTDDAPWRPQTVASSLTLEVQPTQNLLAVAVVHPPQARPGQSIDLKVSLKDDQGKPVAGEATVWLVDEAVLSLAKEGPLDPLTSMVVRNRSDTTVWDTRNSVLGRLIEEDNPGGDGSEDDEDGKASRRVRKNFQTVPFYQATVVVPSSGSVTIKVPLSDDLTNFMVRAVAASGPARFGNHQSQLKVRLPVIVQPQLPRFVRQGDRFDGGGVARLVEGAGGAGIVKAEYVGPVLERKRSKDITLSLDKAQSVTFPVEVSTTPAEAPLKVKMEVIRKADGVGDAFEVTIPVLPDGPWQHQVHTVTIGPAAAPLPVPAEAMRAGSGRQSITATHVRGLLELFTAVDVLGAYPHGCLEQKMARVSPPLSLLKLAKRVGGLGVNAPSAIGNVERLLQEFPAHQDDKGLLGFWPGSTGDVQLTARALEFAALAKDAGAVVDDKVMLRARDAVSASLRSDYAFEPALSAWRLGSMAASLRALSRSGAVDDGYLTDLVKGRKTLDATGRADVAVALLKSGRSSFQAELSAIKGELWSSVTFNLVGGKRMVVGLNDPRAVWGGRVLGSSTSSLATVLEALVRLDATNADLPLLLDAVLARGAAAAGFGSTWDNRAAIEAIVAYLDVADPKGQDSVLRLGKERFSLDGTTKLVRHIDDSGAALTASATGVPVQARVAWRYLPQTPGDRLPAVKEGFLVQRSMTVYPIDGSAARRIDDVRAAEQRFMVGDVVELHTTITVDKPMTHVALVVPFGAGFEPLNAALLTTSSEAQTAERDTLAPTSVARLDDAVRYYVTSLPKGTYSVHFRLKATTPGSYTHPGAYAELMYDGAVTGRSDGSRAIIERSTEGK